MKQRTAKGRQKDETPPGAEDGRPRLAVMLSGSGRTLKNLLQAIDKGRLRASVGLVIASRECPGVEVARQAGVPAVVIPGQIPAFQLEHLLREYVIDWVVLAGYLKLLEIPPAYCGRVVNIHPALLPEFGGAGMFGERVHEAVIRSGAKVSGCTVHLCDEGYDTGRILLQKRCPVEPDDTPATLAARIFELECEAYPEALAQLLEDQGSSTVGRGRDASDRGRS